MAAYPLNRLEFEQEKAAGVFNPQFTFENYQQMLLEQEELQREAEERAERKGYELGAPQLELTPEDEAALDRAWARVAAEKSLPKRDNDCPHTPPNRSKTALEL
jgi:hypothetical protein